MRQWRLTIGTTSVEVGCDVPACIPMLDAILQPYQRTQQSPDIVFHIQQKDEGMTLTADGELLWYGHDAAETAAGFEVHLYSRLLALLQPACLSIHAAAVRIGEAAVCLAGISGAGKSSLCTAALLDGNRYLSDEFSLLDNQGRIVPFPRPLQWGKQRHPAFTHAAMKAAGFGKFRFIFPDYRGRMIGNLLWFPPQVERQPLPLAAIIFPTYRPDAVTVPTPVLRSQALMEIATHMHHRLPPAELIRELNRRIPPDTRFLKLPFHDARQGWDAVKAAIGS